VIAASSVAVLVSKTDLLPHVAKELELQPAVTAYIGHGFLRTLGINGTS
jgi:hypothetical protein